MALLLIDISCGNYYSSVAIIKQSMSLWCVECAIESYNGMHEEIDKRNKLDQEVFSYRVSKEGKVSINWHSKQVMILTGRQAQKFIAKIADLDGVAAQLAMAKITGNFKHGNER